jgi:hypothetical protein
MAESTVALPPVRQLERTMRGYPIYPLSKASRVDGVPIVIVCETDDEAIAQAQQMLEAHDLEVWQGIRRMRRLTSPRNSEAPR